MNTKDKIKFFHEQELQYRFESFSNSDAWEIGKYLAEKAQNEQLSYSVAITINDNTIFQFANVGSNKLHEIWLKRKSNTVNTIYKSTAQVKAMLEDFQETPGTNRWQLDPKEYAFIAGGFPITLTTGRVIGSIAVSGLLDYEDHDLIIEALEYFFKKH